MSNQKPRVLIVGGGPSGLIFALTLLKNQIPVRIIEKASAPRIGQRGAGIMPRSLEMFELLGLIDEVLRLAIPTPTVRKYEMPEGTKVASEFEMAPQVPATPACPYLNVVLLGQDRLEKIFHTALAEYQCQVELGTELVAFNQNENGVEVNLIRNGVDADPGGCAETSQYDWVIGADGARGNVRKLTGLPFVGETRHIENLVVGDIHVEGLSREYWHLWGDVSSTLISLRPTEDPTLFNFVIAGRNVNHTKLSTDKEAVRRCFQENSGTKTNLKFNEVAWLSYYTPNIRMVQSMECGRVFLVGDSAHVHSPTGGQGMNCGVQDSFNLAWKLALVMKGLATPSLLHTYTEERLPVIKEMLDRTTKLLNRTFASSGPASLSKSDGFLQLGVNCRWSSIVYDERKLIQDAEDADFADYDFGEQPEQEDALDSYGVESSVALRAGDRAPDATCLREMSGRGISQSRLFRVFSASHHTILIFTPAIREAGPILKVLEKLPKGISRSVVITERHLKSPGDLRSADLIFEDTKRYAHAAYGVGEEWGVFIIRPDGIVGAVSRGSRGVQQYFTNLLYHSRKLRR